MDGIFDKGVLGIPCPACGHKTKKTIAWIKANEQMICDGCGRTVTLECEKLIEGINQANCAIAGLLKGKGKRR